MLFCLEMSTKTLNSSRLTIATRAQFALERGQLHADSGKVATYLILLDKVE